MKELSKIICSILDVKSSRANEIRSNVITIIDQEQLLIQDRKLPSQNMIKCLIYLPYSQIQNSVVYCFNNNIKLLVQATAVILHTLYYLYC